MAPLADGWSYAEWNATYNAFSFGIAAMGCATIFFWLQLANVSKSYRTALIITGIVTCIATYHYFRIFNSWVEAFKVVSTDGGDYTVTLTGTPFNARWGASMTRAATPLACWVEAGKAPRRLDASDAARPVDRNSTMLRKRPPRRADRFYRYKHPACWQGSVTRCGGGQACWRLRAAGFCPRCAVPLGRCWGGPHLGCGVLPRGPPVRLWPLRVWGAGGLHSPGGYVLLSSPGALFHCRRQRCGLLLAARLLLWFALPPWRDAQELSHAALRYFRR